MGYSRVYLYMLIICNYVHFTLAKSKPIILKINSRWLDTPILAETCEYFASENEESFWNFINELQTLEFNNKDYNNRENYDLLIRISKNLLNSQKLSLLKFSLSVRSFSPRVQMHIEIAKEKHAPMNCETFVEINNVITCEIHALNSFIKLAHNQTKPLLVKSDHQHPSAGNDDVIAILYSQIGSPQFKEWHKKLVELSERRIVTYVFRHYVHNPSVKKTTLSGYGVELAIKNTEYKAKDDTKVNVNADAKDDSFPADDDVQGFIFSKLRDLHPDLESNLKEFRQHLIESQSDSVPLKVWQLQDLSYQAGQLVSSKPIENQLTVLNDISQNFPSRIKELIKVQVKEEFRKEVIRNQRSLESSLRLSAGESALFINGRQADLDIYDVFNLLDSIKSDGRLMDGLHSLTSQFPKLATIGGGLLMLETSEDEEINYAVDIRDDTVYFINDLEKDRRYSNWPSSIQDLLRPSFPGMLRHIRKNIFNMVVFMNPSDMAAIELAKTIEAFYVHNAPVRIGIVFVVREGENDKTEVGFLIFSAFHFIAKHDTPARALSFLTDIFDKARSSTSLNIDLVKEYLKMNFGDSIINDIEKNDSDYKLQQKKGLDFYSKLGFTSLPQVLINGIPMKTSEIKDEMEEAVVKYLSKQTSELQKAVYNGFLKDDMDMYEYIMTRKYVMPRLNSRVLSPTSTYLDLMQPMFPTLLSNFEIMSNLDSPSLTSAISVTIKYLTKNEEQVVRGVTHWIITDLDSKLGRKLFSEAIKQMKHSNGVRLGLIHSQVPQTSGLSISKVIQVALDSLNLNSAKNFIVKLLKEENVEALYSGEKYLADFSVGNMNFGEFEAKLSQLPNDIFVAHQLFIQKVLKFPKGSRGIITNGKILGPFQIEEYFIEEDFTLLEKYTSNFVTKIEKKIKPLKMDSNDASDLIMKFESLLLSEPNKEKRKEVKFAETEYSVLRFPPEEDGPSYDVVAILDPTTRAAQKYTQFIMVLKEVVNVNITLFLNCQEKLSEMPLKSYYRLVLNAEPEFASTGELIGPSANFHDMTEKALLTLNVDAPESWLVEAIYAPYDLDNIYLSEVDTKVEAIYELENLLLEGHCYDVLNGQPPRGLQFNLGTNSTPAMVDTTVMANLGYFQLKARPGLWTLMLRKGRSRDLYDITSQDLTDTPVGISDVIVMMDSFKSKIIKIKVLKKVGKENENLLNEDEPSMGIWESISQTFSDTPKDSDSETDNTINIFSLASGHLYERLLRIMMLSVLKNTKTPVKFWFLKNYLSPGFKDFIPLMAKQYNFEYELVQYKWPRWLHQQTEKQRIIWGYKILFLDVLFPLNVNKIIFVDADQTVRADMKELNDLDLDGAPYGYVPFCESRKEMDGYRFWKTGYWSSHLGHRKYHISALYVVDLKKFRKIAAGDRLRGQYQGLSQDPNSLSNLDQDLPNNMIHQVAIKSLPQEWLWCETWCSDEEKLKAKTIDLCNNPRTKEPKLQAAQRILPEWSGYDAEIRLLWEKFYNITSLDKDTHTEL